MYKENDVDAMGCFHELLRFRGGHGEWLWLLSIESYHSSGELNSMSNNVKQCQTMSQNDAEFLSLSSQIEKVFNCAMQTALHLTTPDSLRTSGYLGLFQAEAARDTGHAGPTCWTCRLGGKNASRFVSGTEFATATNSTKQKQSKT